MTENKRFNIIEEFDIDGNSESAYIDYKTNTTFSFAEPNCDYKFIKHINKEFEKLEKEKEELKSDLIDHSALIKMLEDYKALNIEEIIWNLAGFESNEDFDKEFKKYLEDAKKRCFE